MTFIWCHVTRITIRNLYIYEYTNEEFCLKTIITLTEKKIFVSYYSNHYSKKNIHKYTNAELQPQTQSLQHENIQSHLNNDPPTAVIFGQGPKREGMCLDRRLKRAGIRLLTPAEHKPLNFTMQLQCFFPPPSCGFSTICISCFLSI